MPQYRFKGSRTVMFALEFQPHMASWRIFRMIWKGHFDGDNEEVVEVPRAHWLVCQRRPRFALGFELLLR
jgi:hypothetical protein